MSGSLALRYLLAVLGAALLLAAGATPARAQGDVQPGLTAAQRCLTPDAQQRGTPIYPPELYKAGHPGRVVVDLVFGTRDERPEVTVLESEGGDDFVQAVLAHVRQLRTPCLEDAEITSRLRQEYVFEHQRVNWRRNTDPDAARKREMLQCLTRIDGTKAPGYPSDARREMVVGRVIVQMLFTAPDQPPQVRSFAQPGRSILAVNSEGWAKDYRMPCLKGGPVGAERTFVYRLEGDAIYGFKDLGFMRYIAGIKDLDKQRIRFDTRTMGCPFEVKLDYRQPLMPNAVGEVGERNPARTALLDWLARSELQLSRTQRLSVFGDTIAMDIPCVDLDLKPKEST